MDPVNQAALLSTTITVPTVTQDDASSTYHFDGRAVRVMTVDGEPWFMAADVCAALSLSNPSVTVQSLDEDERAKFSLGRQGEAIFVSEGGLYALIMRTRRAMETGSAAHRFRKWVTGEVLPSIRKTGAYVVPAAPVGMPAINVRDPAQLQAITLQLLQVTQELTAEVAQERQGRIVAEATVEEQRPMVEAYEAFLDDRGMCNLRTAARAIDAPSHLFIDWLKDRKYVIRENGDLQPAAQMRRDGYMKLRAGPDANGKLRNQAMVTRAGLEWLRQRWHVGPGRVLALQAAQAQRQGRLDV